MCSLFVLEKFKKKTYSNSEKNQKWYKRYNWKHISIIPSLHNISRCAHYCWCLIWTRDCHGEGKKCRLNEEMCHLAQISFSLLMLPHVLWLFLCWSARCGRGLVCRAWWSRLIVHLLHVFSHDEKGDWHKALWMNSSHCNIKYKTQSFCFSPEPGVTCVIWSVVNLKAQSLE